MSEVFVFGFDIDVFDRWIPCVLDWFWIVLPGLWRAGIE